MRAGDRVADDRVAHTNRRLRDGKYAVNRTAFITVRRTGQAHRRRVAVEDIDGVIVVRRIDRDTRVARRDAAERDLDGLGTFNQAESATIPVTSIVAVVEPAGIVTVPDNAV